MGEKGKKKKKKKHGEKVEERLGYKSDTYTKHKEQYYCKKNGHPLEQTKKDMIILFSTTTVTVECTTSCESCFSTGKHC